MAEAAKKATAESASAVLDRDVLGTKNLAELYEIARGLNVQNYRRHKKQDLVDRILEAHEGAHDGPDQFPAGGVLEILPEGFGFIRVSNYLPSADDIHVSQAQIRRWDLWNGDSLEALVRPPKKGEKYIALTRVTAVNGHSPDVATRRIPFENLTPIYPCERIKLETSTQNISMRLMDLFNPVGKGQRALIVSPPKAGKTTILKQIANSITSNHPEIQVIALLIDERPEEVTDMRRSIQGEVVASTFDELADHHIKVAELVAEKAKRQVEVGADVVILLDSITRLARAYNNVIPPSGRTLSGGLDPNALQRPKRFFGAARKIEEGGSPTIIATALVETGSRMDDVIYEEFKGTGNSEMHLDRRLADRRIFPAIDIKRSGTRKEELLLSPDEIRKERTLRKTLEAGDTAEVTEFIADRLARTQTNREFLMAISD
ncbi:MAG: transcription termination factor Rho [Candidatus Sericytochromatia bacterium]|nr:transcription termination factor Rho [Candidatus Tanganyikabacteria bacterium]